MGAAARKVRGGRNRWRIAPWRIAMWGGAAALLALPAVAMRFTAEVDWGVLDFVVAGAMLAMACAGFEAAVRMGGNRACRAGAAIAILAAFLLVWVNLAVGMIGEAGDPANLVHVGVLLVAAAGARVARFRAAGLVRAMLATAVAQGLAAALTWSLGLPREALLTCFWVILWLASALLFARGSR